LDQASFISYGIPALAFKFGWIPDSPQEKTFNDFVKTTTIILRTTSFTRLTRRWRRSSIMSSTTLPYASPMLLAARSGMPKASSHIRINKSLEGSWCRWI
jgi:hypothetical protein